MTPAQNVHTLEALAEYCTRAATEASAQAAALEARDSPYEAIKAYGRAIGLSEAATEAYRAANASLRDAIVELSSQ